MKKQHIIFILFLILIIFTVACGTARRGPTVVTPINNMTAVVAEGEHEFMEYCNKCHPGGAAGLGPAINNKALPGLFIRFQVRNGLGTMPAFSKDVISKEEMNKLVAYLKTIRKNDEKREAYEAATARN